MRTSLQGAMEIIAHEGIVTSRYKDSVGVWTIGVGHTAAAGPPVPSAFTGTMTVKEAIDLFRRDLAKYEKRVNAAFRVPLAQHEFDAAVSFDFNTGAIHKATWVELFNQGARAKAIAAIMNWSKPREVIGRRQKEQKLFSTGLYSGDGFATVYPASPAGAVQWSKGKRVDLRREYGGIPTDKPQDAPKPSPVPERRPEPETPPASSSPGWWAILIQFIANLFKKDR